MFPSLMDVAIERPLFVVGIPRSGTTLMHRLLAGNQDAFTTLPLWELLFAPALCEKHALSAAARVDRRIGSPLGRLVCWAERRLAATMSDVHPTTLKSPEEDYLGLLPFGGCFLEVLVRPSSRRVWDLVWFDRRVGRRRQKRLIKAYRGLLARHLCFHGTSRCIVSKNPSFTSWIEALSEEFPDARFIALRRDLNESLPSQLSSMRDGFAWFGHDVRDPHLVDRFVQLFQSYWLELDRHAGSLAADRFQLVGYRQLRSDPLATVDHCLRSLDIPISQPDRSRLAEMCGQARRYVSSHHYQLSEFGLTDQSLEPFRERFRESEIPRYVERSGRDQTAELSQF